MRSDLVGLSGGKKQFWLRVNRPAVMDFYFKHGPVATMTEFGMGQQTFERFLAREHRDIELNRLSKNDKWVFNAAMERSRELAGRISRLEEWKAEAEPVINVGRALLDATSARLQLQSGKSLPNDELLKLGNFGGKSKK